MSHDESEITFGHMLKLRLSRVVFNNIYNDLMIKPIKTHKNDKVWSSYYVLCLLNV